jgi:hypothetical protein
MQEEEAAPSKKRSYSKNEFRDQSKSKWSSRYLEDTKHEVKQQEGHKTEDKLDALRTSCQARVYVLPVVRSGIEPTNVLINYPYMLLICPKRIYFPEHFCCCFSSNLRVLNTTNTD